MKIQKVTAEHRPKVYALLQRAFPASASEAELVRKLHDNNRPLHEWVCIQTNKVVAYVGFSRAFHGKQVCGLHLAPMAVAPDFQRQGVGTELLRFALRQESIMHQALFVLGAPAYFQRFGFAPCSQPICPFDEGNAHFLSMCNDNTETFTVGYEAEFKHAALPPSKWGKKRRPR